jgi:hypothetical protein
MLLSNPLWRIQRTDWIPLLLIAFFPILAAMPGLIGLYHADPMLYIGAVAKSYTPGPSLGMPYADPNNGYTTQALGYRAALDWLHGIVPWWNYFSGVGLPLAAEYQPAVFFPPTLLLLLPNGMLVEHILLQVLAGWGTYGLLRQLGLSRLACITGGLLFAFDGALAWFDHASALPVPFLPWLLLGVERAFAKAATGTRHGWRLFALALALGMLAGFPETAYINGLMAFAWAVLRLCQSPRRVAFAARLLLGAIVGIAVTAPQILAFFSFLPHAFLAAHDGTFAHIALEPAAALPSLYFPYFFGTIAAHSAAWDRLDPIWGSMGGYTTLITIVVGLYGAIHRRTPLTWLLLGWAFMSLSKSFGLEPMTTLWNHIPGIGQAAFARYAVPTWEMAFIVLAAQTLDDLRGNTAANPKIHRFAIGFSWILVCIGAVGAAYVWRYIHHSPPLRNAAIIGVLWSVVTVGIFHLALSARRFASHRLGIIAALLILNSALMFSVPTRSNPKAGEVDTPAIRFLQSNLGLQRFYSLGQIQANYGAYFGIASINHNYLPVNQRWVDWVRGNLDAYADPIVFNGNYPRPQGEHAPSQKQELVRNLANYEWVGVKYIVAPVGRNPLAPALTSDTNPGLAAPLYLKQDQSISGTLPSALAKTSVQISEIGVPVGNFYNSTDGILSVEVCADNACAKGRRNLLESSDNAMFFVALDHDLTVPAGTPIHYRFRHEGGHKGIVLWLGGTSGAAQSQNLVGTDVPEGYGLQMDLQIRTDAVPLARQVYTDHVMSIYALPDPKPYFDTLGQKCELHFTDRENVTADCSAPATLLRRELFFPGWTASVDNAAATITEHRDLFQTVSLPAGRSHIVFRYEPPNMIWAWFAMFAAFALLIGSSLPIRIGKKHASEESDGC